MNIDVMFIICPLICLTLAFEHKEAKRLNKKEPLDEGWVYK